MGASGAGRRQLRVPEDPVDSRVASVRLAPQGASFPLRARKRKGGLLPPPRPSWFWAWLASASRPFLLFFLPERLESEADGV